MTSAPSAPPPSDPGVERTGVRAAVAGALAVGLVLVVAVASTADRLPVGGSSGHLGLPTPLTATLASAAAVGAVLAVELVLAGLLYGRLFLSRPGAQGARVGGWRRLLESLGPFVFVLMVVGLVILLRRFAQVRKRAPVPFAPRPHAPLGRGGFTVSGRAGFLTWSDAVLVATAVTLAVVAIATILWVRRMRQARRAETAEEGAPPEGDGGGIGPARHRPPRSPREAIWCALADLEDRCAAWGTARRPHEVPETFLGRALPGPAGSGPPAGRLTSLYQAARFSDHPVDQGTARSAAAAAAELGRSLHRLRSEAPDDG